MTNYEITQTERFDLSYLFAILIEALVRFTKLETEMEDFEIEMDEDQYEEMLNDVYDTVNVCGIEYPAGSALRELDPVAFSCGKSDYESSMDKEESEEYKELEEEKEDIETYLEEIHEAIQETPFGIASDYSESPCDFFTSHIVSSDSINPSDVIPVLLDLIKNTPEYAQMLVAPFFFSNLEYAMELRHDTESINLHETMYELMEVCEQYAPENFVFGFGEDNGSDLGYWFQAPFYTSRKGYKIDLHIESIDYKYTFEEEEKCALLCADMLENRFVALPHISAKTGSGGWLIFDVETETVLDVHYRYGTKEIALELLRNGKAEPKSQRYAYVPGGDEAHHYVQDKVTMEYVAYYWNDRETALSVADQLNGKGRDSIVCQFVESIDQIKERSR